MKNYHPKHIRAIGGKHRAEGSTDQIPTRAACFGELRAGGVESGRLLRNCRRLTCAKHQPDIYATQFATHKVVGW